MTAEQELAPEIRREQLLEELRNGTQGYAWKEMELSDEDVRRLSEIGNADNVNLASRISEGSKVRVYPRENELEIEVRTGTLIDSDTLDLQDPHTEYFRTNKVTREGVDPKVAYSSKGTPQDFTFRGVTFRGPTNLDTLNFYAEALHMGTTTL